MRPDPHPVSATAHRRVDVPDPINRFAEHVLDAAMVVHRELGPGLLESAYEECVAWELELRRVPVHRQVAVEIVYRGRKLEAGYRADLLVGDPTRGWLLAELKATESIQPIHRAQVITYLRILDLPLGLLLNFNAPLLRDGTERILNARWSGKNAPSGGRG